MITKNLSACFRLLLYIGSACALLSCSRDSQDETNQDASLVVRVSGLEDYVAVTTSVELRQGSSSKQAPAMNTASGSLFNTTEMQQIDNKEHEMHFSNDFDVDFEIVKAHPASTAPKETMAGENGTKMSAKRSLMARQPLGSTVRYRLLVYRENETNPVVNVEATGSTFPAVGIATGFNYRWVAVSTNETTSAPNVTNNIVSASDIANKDFLYASGTFFSEYGQNYLNIVFKRYTSQIQLTVDSRGMFGNIAPNSNISFAISSGETLSETADFNVQDSSFSNFQPVALSSNNMTNTDPALRTGTIYTVRPRPVAAGSLQLRFNPLLLTLDDGSTRTFADNSLTFGSAFSPVRGSSYSISARLIESGIRIGTSPLRWARSNLTYDASAAAGFRYRFRPHPVNYIFNPNVDLWNFGASTPTIPFDAIDPCRRVYPNGTWKLPSDQDLAGSISSAGRPNSLEAYTLPSTGAPGIIANWNRSTDQPASSAYPEMDNLRLPFYGYRDTTGNLLQQPAINGTQLSGLATYFTAQFYDRTETDPNTNTSVTTRHPTLLELSYNGESFAGSTTNTANYTQRLVYGQLETTSVLNQGRNIRCVRVVNP
ncbi:fimbrillin family protein [Sphingobacterium deserti]|uniref:Lipoprotein n=1 Tax=Sphingobacterium deserti TaxID=1229276 RepID=A0A0B8T448_9SPHI|nr:hypothetical protein [Sphingobacterium deserti]KGE14133.1 hypothetical protein DI53_1963 [Sphingobacterium deserti]